MGYSFYFQNNKQILTDFRCTKAADVIIIHASHAKTFYCTTPTSETEKMKTHTVEKMMKTSGKLSSVVLVRGSLVRSTFCSLMSHTCPLDKTHTPIAKKPQSLLSEYRTEIALKNIVDLENPLTCTVQYIIIFFHNNHLHVSLPLLGASYLE